MCLGVVDKLMRNARMHDGFNQNGLNGSAIIENIEGLSFGQNRFQDKSYTSIFLTYPKI